MQEARREATIEGGRQVLVTVGHRSVKDIRVVKKDSFEIEHTTEQKAKGAPVHPPLRTVDAGQSARDLHARGLRGDSRHTRTQRKTQETGKRTEKDSTATSRLSA